MKKIREYMIIIAYSVLVIGLAFSALENINAPWLVIYVSLALIASYTIKQLYCDIEIEKKKLIYILTLFDTVLIILLSFKTIGTSFRIFYFVLIYEVIFMIDGKKAYFICSFFYLLDLAANFYKIGRFDMSQFLKMEIYNLPEYVLVAVSLFLVKYIIEINNGLYEAKSELYEKNVELNMTYDTLKKAFAKNEDYLIMQEKNKLAAEIHDTVGHTLTTALYEMEAADTLINSDIDKASEKIKLAKNQVRCGLNEVRSSVSALKTTNVNYYDEMLEIINNIQKHTEISIRYDIDNIENESEAVKKCALRALQEGITNSIRHGNATAILFKLKYDNNFLLFSLEDNGCGSSYLNKGFGLMAMEQRVIDANGELKLMTGYNEGFNIYIKFNLGRNK